MRKLQNIISSNMHNYQSILEIHFVEFLRASGSSAKTQKNYRCDLNHFFQWIFSSEIVQPLKNSSSLNEFLIVLTVPKLNNYKDFLLQKSVPTATINRRLSSIRMFFSACQHFGLMSDNPAKSISNVPKQITQVEKKEKILQEFIKELEYEGASKKTISNYASDIKQFLEWLESAHTNNLKDPIRLPL